jgi:hypothetical protein
MLISSRFIAHSPFVTSDPAQSITHSNSEDEAGSQLALELSDCEPHGHSKNIRISNPGRLHIQRDKLSEGSDDQSFDAEFCLETGPHFGRSHGTRNKTTLNTEGDNTGHRPGGRDWDARPSKGRQVQGKVLIHYAE